LKTSSVKVESITFTFAAGTCVESTVCRLSSAIKLLDESACFYLAHDAVVNDVVDRELARGIAARACSS